MLKCVACDVDGTLLHNREEKISDKLIGQIRELTSYGVLFAVASGRPYSNLRRVFGPVQDDIAYVVENGAMCFYKGKTIHKEIFPHDTAMALLKDILAFPGCEILLSTPRINILQPKTEKYFDYVTKKADYDAEVTEDILSIEEEIIKIAVCHFDGVETCDAYFQEKYGKELAVVTSGSIWMDFMTKGTNKGSTLEMLLRKFSIDPKDVIAFGDQFNDVEMLELVGCGYAVENAVPGVKALADKTCRKVEDILEEELLKLRTKK